jgi:hypothetical protein
MVQLPPSITEWAIGDDTGSDHSLCRIRLSIPETKSIETSPRQRRIWAKTFKESIEENKIDLSNLTGERDTLRFI